MNTQLTVKAFQVSDEVVSDVRQAKEYLDKFGAFQNKKPPNPELVYRLCGGKEKYIEFKEEIQRTVLRIKAKHPKLNPNFELSKKLPEEDIDIKDRMDRIKI